MHAQSIGYMTAFIWCEYISAAILRHAMVNCDYSAVQLIGILKHADACMHTSMHSKYMYHLYIHIHALEDTLTPDNTMNT